MIKRVSRKKGHVIVTFVVDEAVGAEQVHLCGEFNEWSQASHLMDRGSDGGWQLGLELPAGAIYRFRYLLDGDRWENDWAADAYIPNAFGGEDSVVDLTVLDGKTLTAPTSPRQPGPPPEGEEAAPSRPPKEPRAPRATKEKTQKPAK